MGRWDRFDAAVAPRGGVHILRNEKSAWTLCGRRAGAGWELEYGSEPTCFRCHMRALVLIDRADTAGGTE